MRRLPAKMLSEHGACIPDTNKNPEPAWRQVLRLNQSLWRQEQGLEARATSAGFLGSCLAPAAARTGANLMSDAARLAAERELRRPEKLIESQRLFDNLLASQSLCFSIFGELQANLAVASKVLSAVLQKPMEVTRIELEHSPARGDPSYTGDHSAADAYVEFTASGHNGFLCIETKYFEDLTSRPDLKPGHRARYSNLAALMGCFRDGSAATLSNPPLEQLWRGHLLAGSILHHPTAHFDEGLFVLLYPNTNEACAQAAQAYRECLLNEDTFRVVTLESVIGVLLEHGKHDWARSLKERYIEYQRVEHVYQEYYLKETARCARMVREDLGALQSRERHRVWFRPSSSGFAMVGLLPEKPQLGKGYRRTAEVLGEFEAHFQEYCDGPAPGRCTPEKRLQSYLISDALSHGRCMQRIDAELIFLTDELVIPSIGKQQRLDLLALRRVGSGARLALIELKSERAMAELLRQTRTYAEFLNDHVERLAELAGAILGDTVLLTEQTEKWIVWPAPKTSVPDARNAELAKVGIRVVTYEEASNGFAFQISPPFG